MASGRPKRERRTVIAALLSVGFGVGVPAAAVLVGFSLGLLDPLRGLNHPVAEAAVARKAQSITEARLPALADLTAALTDGPSGWTGNGAVTAGASLPTAVSCVSSPITPVVTLSRDFTVDTVQLSVTLTAYVAGAGATIFGDQYAGIPGCGIPGGSGTVAAGPADGPGVARFDVSTYQADQLTTTAVWRRGDVLAYLSGADPTTEAGLGESMDQTLERALGPDCVEQTSLATDAVRDPFAVEKRSDFRGLTVDDGITQSPTPLPSPLPSISAGPLGTTLPGPSPAATPSQPPWPVYPPLPTPSAIPAPPSAPSSEPPTHAPLREAQVDKLGPGCGWAFTGMLAPTPPNVLTAAEVAAKQAALQPLLARDQAAWQQSVNDYWAAYTAYLGVAQAYAAYTDQVNQVAAAWSVIDGQWETYLALKASYDHMVADRDSFLRAQAAAQAGYDTNQATCTPSPAAVPTDATLASVAPAAPAAGAAPAERPAATTSPVPTVGGGGLSTTPAPAPTAADPAIPAPAAASPEPAAPPTDAPPAAATSAAAPAPTGTACELPPDILSATPPPTPSGPPPTKPADPRPSKAPGARGHASAKPTRG